MPQVTNWMKFTDGVIQHVWTFEPTELDGEGSSKLIALDAEDRTLAESGNTWVEFDIDSLTCLTCTKFENGEVVQDNDALATCPHGHAP